QTPVKDGRSRFLRFHTASLRSSGGNALPARCHHPKLYKSTARGRKTGLFAAKIKEKVESDEVCQGDISRFNDFLSASTAQLSSGSRAVHFHDFKLIVVIP
ncbi:MAG: hypothetical protein Q4A88_04735, partial [Clostridia bacterium]|nr:hypothetical protein [Clostridia bacterium]